MIDSEEEVPAGFVPTQDDFNAGMRLLGGGVHTVELNGQIVRGRVVKGMFIPDQDVREALADAAEDQRQMLGLD